MMGKGKRVASSDRLWEVDYEINNDKQDETLLVLARDSASAAAKALKFARSKFFGVCRVVKVEQNGTIDVF
jgi:ribosomal protein L16/L10AE